MELCDIMRSPQLVPASSKCMLNIPYGDAVRILLKGNTFSTLKPFFLGLATQLYKFELIESEFKCFVIEFTDIGFYALFRENVEAFADTLIALEDVEASRQMQQLQALLAEANNAAARI